MLTPDQADQPPRRRHLGWDGCFNVRDLGGLPTEDGRVTAWGSVIRADSLDRLTEAGWRAAHDYGVRTVIDLRNDDELAQEQVPRPSGITTIRVPMDDVEDQDLWRYLWDNELDGTPLYYRPFLERKPERCAAAVAAVARAAPGGVVIHCGIGRDRTGLVSLLLLRAVGVMPEEIAADYELSGKRLPPLWATLGEPDQTDAIADVLRRKRTSARAAILETLDGWDVTAYLRSAGLADDDLTALRERLLG